MATLCLHEKNLSFFGWIVLELELGCSRAMCCSPVCVLLHGQRNSLYPDKNLSCLSVGFFVLKGAMVIVIHGYCWCGL